MYLVGKISKTLAIQAQLPGQDKVTDIDIDLCWAAHMVGVCPVFATYEAAKKHAKDAFIIKLIEGDDA